MCYKVQTATEFSFWKYQSTRKGSMLWPGILFFEQRLFSAGSHNFTQHKSYRLAGKSTKNIDRCVAQTESGCNKLPCLMDYSPMLTLYLI